jgi:DNA topoisomerase-3
MVWGRAVEQGRAVRPSLLRLDGSSTAPPGYLTESDLIGIMDREGIGTDATIATHIATILTRCVCHLGVC